jgi:glycosyltransferase involved in cell wall biosynthesis
MDRYPEYEFLFSDIMSPVGHLLLHCQSVPHRISRLPQWLKVIKGDKAQAKLYRQQQDLQNKNRRFLMVSKQLEQDYITHFKLPEAHCQVAYPGVTTQNHSQPNPLTPVPVIGMVGSRSVNKGCWLLLLALWGLILCQQPFKLVLIHPNLAKDLLSRCLLAPIRWFRSVTVLPFQINLEPFYEQLHVFVLPSNNEGFGLVTLEAMAKGAIPIVASTAGSAELIEHGHNGFVFQREKRPVLALFNCLRAVCQLPEPAFSHVQNNALATAQQATWQGFAATVVDHVFAEAPEHTDGLKASA